jgi:hypothetical protein
MENTLKRQRVNSNGDTAPPIFYHYQPQHLTAYIDCLYERNSELVKSLLLQFACQRYDIAHTLHSHYDYIVQADQARVIGFDHYSKDVWHNINSGSRGLKGSAQYEASFQVFEDTCAIIEHIREQASHGACSFGTRRSALEH